MPIFVRRGAQRATLSKGVVSTYVTRRLISVRAYDYEHMLVQANVVEGALVGNTLDDDVHSRAGRLHPPSQRKTGVLLLLSRSGIAE